MAAAFVACSGDEPFAETGEPGLRIVAGADVTDTISTTPAQALVVELRGDDGKLLAGAEVRFESTDTNLMLVSSAESSEWKRLAGTITDEEGRASVRVRLGDHIGDGRIIISVPLYALMDTARYTILAGKGEYIYLTPRDTTLAIGEEFTFRGTVADRKGNPRPDAATFTLEGDAITLSPSGDVTARAPGIARVRIRANVRGITSDDSATVTIRPSGTIAWGDWFGHIVIATVDGTEQRRITQEGLAPTWEPGGDRIVATNYYGLIIANADNTVTALPTPGFSSSTWPEWSNDGFIYFSGITENGPRLGRLRPDGTDLETILPDETATMPSPSPDGTRVVYVNGEQQGPLRILDLQAGTTTLLLDAVEAQAPRWSPDGEWIAFTRVYNGLWLIRPDGTDAHRIREHTLLPAISWSPDSRWIVGAAHESVLVDLTTGFMSNLPFNHDYPAWKR